MVKVFFSMYKLFLPLGKKYDFQDFIVCFRFPFKYSNESMKVIFDNYAKMRGISAQYLSKGKGIF